MSPAVKARCASTIPSHKRDVNGTAAPGGGGSGTRQAITAAHSSASPAPVKAETRIASGTEATSQAGGRSLLLTTYWTAASGWLGHSGGVEASSNHKQRSAAAAV